MAYFAVARFGQHLNLGILVRHIAKVSRRMFEVPEFLDDVIADEMN